ncbi:MAG TPA: FliI/YscN family ATPase [candidate division Zixibacteria bacterium]|nr:FliI/YscN family ATPase [candidate division Zixibacteria bacterium]
MSRLDRAATGPDQDLLFPYRRRLQTVAPFRFSGTVTEVTGLLIASRGPWLPVGGVCHIYPLGGGRPTLAEVVGFRGEQTLLIALGELRGVGPGSRVVALAREAHYPVGEELLGRVVDGLGRPIDGKGVIAAHSYPIYAGSSNPLDREEIREPLDIGIRSINGLVTLGKGQRVAIMAGAGVGKSTLLAMIARNTRADVKVIALIGERGREVEEFVARTLPAEERDRMVVVAATSEAPALVRVRGAFIATTIAEYFRDRGQDVLLLMDSLTRFAMAQREAGLAAGEPPSTKGYTPSVFALLPRLLERAGSWKGKGSITGLYTVLMEGDDPHEPIADAVRSLTDGHLQLSRRLAEQAHYPAVDVLSSVSRVRSRVTSPEHQRCVSEIIRIMAARRDAEDLIQIGAYVGGKNPDVDRALELAPRLRDYLCQRRDEDVPLEASIRGLAELLAG